MKSYKCLVPKVKQLKKYTQLSGKGQHKQTNTHKSKEKKKKKMSSGYIKMLLSTKAELFNEAGKQQCDVHVNCHGWFSLSIIDCLEGTGSHSAG